MKISYNWLRELVAVDAAPRDLAARLTMVGLAVDAVEAHDDDFVLDLDLTSNRPDCLSHLGVAREAAAVMGKALGNRDSERGNAGDTVEILNPELCPRYTARVIKGVKIGPSPKWLIKRLEAMGQRSVNNVADVTNYVMLELGQPLHAFDLAQLRGERIIVRTAGAGERITTLDGEERALTPDMLVIADAERAVALAGIKGGADSGISERTTDVLLEAAYFAPAQVRATAKQLGLSTEASYRFERGTDPEIVPVASQRAAQMIVALAGGALAGELTDLYPLRRERQPINFRRARYTRLTGLPLTLSEAARILRALGFTVEADVANDALTAIAPSWRVDVHLEEDLIEEVARIAGYDNLPVTLPGSAGAGAYLPGEAGRRAARRTLTAHGYNEAVSFSFVNAATDALLSQAPNHARLALRNPIDETQAHMRTTLLGGLLKALEHNFNYGLRHVRLFEIGKCFIDVRAERPREIERLALVATGARNDNDWLAAATRLDFYDVKGTVEAIAAALNLPALDCLPVTEVSHLHPGRAAQLQLVGSTVGQIGQLHPRVAAGYKFKQPVFVAELDFEALLLAARAEVRYHPLPKFPTVVRDIALLVDTSVSFAALEAVIRQVGIAELVSVRLFDRYTGKELPPGKHSLALSLRYRAPDRTLTDEEVNVRHEQIMQRLTEQFAAEIR